MAEGTKVYRFTISAYWLAHSVGYIGYDNCKRRRMNVSGTRTECSVDLLAKVTTHKTQAAEDAARGEAKETRAWA